MQIIRGGTIGILTALVTKARKPRSLKVNEPDPIRRKALLNTARGALSPDLAVSRTWIEVRIHHGLPANPVLPPTY